MTQPAAPAPEESTATPAEPEGLVEETQVGTTVLGLAANAALRGLSRAARSFLLYDPNNEAIRHFLGEYRTATMAALTEGALDLEIRPFDILLGTEVVYLERDRERSLAFRMFRDGVRRLIIQPEVTWDELLRLLQILSIRYTGVHQAEDDIVTLLWKAGFQHIETVAVEGFVPDEEDSDDEDVDERSVQIRRSVAQLEIPDDWDLPSPPHEAYAAIRYAPLDEQALTELRRQLSSTELPAKAVRLVHEVLALVRDPTDPTTLADLMHFVAEVRSFLLSEGQIAQLLVLVRELAANRDLDPDLIDEFLTQFADTKALMRVLHSVAANATEAPEELVELLDTVPGDHLASLVEVLSDERGQASRRITRALIERYVASRIEYIQQQITDADPQVASDLLRAVASASPALGLELAYQIITVPETDIQLQIQRLLENTQAGEIPTDRLLGMLSSPHEPVRLRVTELLVQAGDPSAYDGLLDYLENPTSGSLATAEIISLGEGLARIDPARASQQFCEWVRPHGLLDRVLGGATQKTHRQWAGVAALGLLPGDEPETCIRWLSKRAGEDLHRHCMKTLVQRRKRGTIHG